MKNKKYLIIGVIVIVVLIILVIGGKNMFNKKPKEIKDIKIFNFSYSVNMSINGNVRYEIECTDKCMMTIKPYEVSEDDKVVMELSSEELNKLESILNKHEVFKWDGFKKYDRNVLDGNSFHLYIRMKSDETVEASGYMKWPKNYGEVRSDLDNFFDELYKKEKAQGDK